MDDEGIHNRVEQLVPEEDQIFLGVEISNGKAERPPPREERAAVLTKVEGVSEYDLRRPMTQTGTNLLGLVKHLASVEYRSSTRLAASRTGRRNAATRR